jgi:hypothetical protein
MSSPAKIATEKNTVQMRRAERDAMEAVRKAFKEYNLLGCAGPLHPGRIVLLRYSAISNDKCHQIGFIKKQNAERLWWG